MGRKGEQRSRLSHNDMIQKGRTRCVRGISSKYPKSTSTKSCAFPLNISLQTSNIRQFQIVLGIIKLAT